MPKLSISDSFIDAFVQLDPADAKRTEQFLDKLLMAPEASSLRPEIVHDAADRSIRSFKVTHDLRAIAYTSGPQLLLLHVARHDKAYEWVKGRCVTCSVANGELLLRHDASDSSEALRTTLCATREDVCRLLSKLDGNRDHGDS